MSSPSPFNPRLVVGLIAAGILAFAAMLLLVAYGGQPGSSGRDGRAHALSVSAVGFKGLVTLVGEFGEARLIREPDDFETENLVVVALEERSRPEDLDNLLEQRRGRPTLIILPKWITMAEPARRGWVRTIGPGLGGVAERALGEGVSVRVVTSGQLPAAAAGEDLLAGLSLPVPRLPQVIEGEAVTPIVPLAGGALIGQLGVHPHYVVADPDLLNNHGLRRPERARAALDLIAGLGPPDASGVDFDLTVNGLGAVDSRSLLQLSLEPPFLAMTLALVVAALLAGLHGAWRFGPARREQRAIALGKAALVENSAGLIRQANREVELGAAYADVIRQDVARLAHAPQGVGEDQVDLYLNRLGKAGRPSFSELAARLHAARDRHGLIAAARALFQWKKDIIR